MIKVIYDGTWAGFLSMVFEVYDQKYQEVNIVPDSNYVPDIFGNDVRITTDQVKSARVWKGLKSRLSKSGRENLYACYLSEIKGMENTLLSFIKMVFSIDGAEEAYGDSAVLKVKQISKMVYREKHRMEAFVRFQLTADDIYYAVVEPDFNVLPLILPHFKKRYADQKWLIYDKKRHHGIYYDLRDVEEVYFKDEVVHTGRMDLQEPEVSYQVLWKDYFNHVNIKERKNNKLHIQHLPKRYWKYLTEKIG